jgi:hypothetical protein
MIRKTCASSRNVLTMAIAIALQLGLVASAIAQVSRERILIPVVIAEPLPGAYDSVWTSEVRLTNGGPSPLEVDGILWDCSLPECGNLPAVLDPGRTFAPILWNPPDGMQGAFIDPIAGHADQVRVSVRLRDLSRQSSTWGTEIPAARERDFVSQEISLADVPLTSGFRNVLRIYELDGLPREAYVRVRIYRVESDATQPQGPPDVLLGETTVRLWFSQPTSRVAHPGYAALSDIQNHITGSEPERVRVSVEPLTSDLRLWAFMTIVHNETQHATVISP